jgi:geranylgeranyl reductase family protein
VTCVVDRALFDKRLAEAAEKAGVWFQLNTHVESLLIDDNGVRTSVKQKGGAAQESSAKAAVDAEGISSRILRQVGLPTLNREMLLYAVETEVENVENTEQDVVEVFLGQEYAPGFYAWLIPMSHERAKIGLAANRGNPRELLRKLMFTHPTASKKLKSSRIVNIAFHPITLGGPIPRLYSNRFFVVGDAASQVKPTTGGGIIVGLTCAKMAAQVLCDGIRADNLSSDHLSSYQAKCRRAMDFDMRVMLMIRRFLNALSDDRLDELIRMCAGLGLDKPVEGVSDIDFQGRSLLRTLRSPRMLAALTYFFFLYVSANP